MPSDVVAIILQMCRAWFTRRVRLHLEPVFVQRMDTGHVTVALTARNLSRFAVTIDDAGFALSSLGRSVPAAPQNVLCSPLPRRLDPREAVTVRFQPHVVDVLILPSEVTAYVSTQCGTRAKAQRKPLRAFRANLARLAAR